MDRGENKTKQNPSINRNWSRNNIDDCIKQEHENGKYKYTLNVQESKET